VRCFCALAAFLGEAHAGLGGGGYLHRGIARRAFERRFSLADHMKVMEASLDNGLLYVDVVREVPEAAKPRTIKIGTTVDTVQPQVMEQKAA
jgi:molecular chaperone IbpA